LKEGEAGEGRDRRARAYGRTQEKRELSKVNQVEVRRKCWPAQEKKTSECFMYMGKVEQTAYGKQTDTVRDRTDAVFCKVSR
jgi:hypothetical protein